MKDRVTLTLDTKLLRRIDASINGAQIKNRSHAVELLLYKALDEGLPQHALILCGANKESVLGVLKKIRGESLLKRNIDHFIEQGIQHIFLITTEPELIKKELGPLPEEVRFIRESTPLGTAGALHLAKPYINGTFILTNASAYKEVDIREMHTFHIHHKGICTIALTSVSDPTQYGVALLNGNRIIAFVEKPRKEHAPSNLISAGFYILDPEVLALIPDGYARMEHDVFPKLAKEDALYGYNFPGTYMDGGTQ